MHNEDDVTFTERFTAKWKQGILTATDQKIILFAMLIQAVLRGTDYIRGILPRGPEFTVLNLAFTPHIVGYWFIAGSLLIVLGIIFKRHIGVWLGHALLWIIYAGMSASAWAAVIRDDGASLRIPGLLSLGFILHFLWWIRTGRDPLPANHSAQTEEVAGPEEAS